MAKIVIYTTLSCPYCTQAKQLLEQQSLPYTEVRVDTDPARLTEMKTITGNRTVPQILLSIGGFNDLSGLVATGELASLLKS